jgi:protein-disulfide isomerase/uncharacterized membrane protein
MALAAVGLAIGVHFYLTLHHLELKYGLAVGNSICNLSAQFSCTAASLSKFSELFGVPMALWGAVTNAALFIWALLYLLADQAEKSSLRTGIMILATFIASVSVLMLVISLTQLNQLCPLCIVTYVLSFITWIGFWKGAPASGIAKSPLSKSPSLPAKNLVLTAVGIFFIGFIVYTGVKKNYSADSKGFEAQINAYIQEWQTSPQLTINPVAPLVKGNPDTNAKFTIVEFADFRCSHCKHAAPTLDAFVKAHPDVRLIFQTYPLDGECNSAIPQANGASCFLARAFLCASKSNKGWEAHDWLFDNQEKMVDTEVARANVETMSKELGLDPQAIKACTESEETRKAIEGQAALGQALNVKGTPSIYANNRSLPLGNVLTVLQKAYDAANETGNAQ